jgi:hypothetical protein
MLFHFVTEILDQTVRELIIFCDSCAGQNKNYTVIRFIHHLIFEVKPFDTIKMVFPIRGHSYLECDKSMGLANQKSHAEIPEDWRAVLRNSRTKPSPFIVIDCHQQIFKHCSNFLNPLYKKTCPIPTRPVLA